MVSIGNRPIPCAFVLKKDPTERVAWESFPLDEGVTEGYNADYTKSAGTSEPYFRDWQGGDWNPINFNLEFRAGLGALEAGPINFAIGRMIGKVNWLKAAAFPRTDTRIVPGKKLDPSTALAAGGVKAGAAEGISSSSGIEGSAALPPMILFVWGSFMTVQGRVTAWTVNWKAPFRPVSGKPQGALISLTFQPESGFYPNWWTVKEGQAPTTIAGRFL